MRSVRRLTVRSHSLFPCTVSPLRLLLSALGQDHPVPQVSAEFAPDGHAQAVVLRTDDTTHDHLPGLEVPSVQVSSVQLEEPDSREAPVVPLPRTVALLEGYVAVQCMLSSSLTVCRTSAWRPDWEGRTTSVAAAVRAYVDAHRPPFQPVPEDLARMHQRAVRDQVSMLGRMRAGILIDCHAVGQAGSRQRLECTDDVDGPA